MWNFILSKIKMWAAGAGAGAGVALQTWIIGIWPTEPGWLQTLLPILVTAIVTYLAPANKTA